MIQSQSLYVKLSHFRNVYEKTLGGPDLSGKCGDFGQKIRKLHFTVMMSTLSTANLMTFCPNPLVLRAWQEKIHINRSNAVKYD